MQSPGGPNRSPHRSHGRRYFYKYVSAEIAILILQSRKLRWSSPLLFNDPFDTNEELRLDFDPAELSKLINEEFATMIEEGRAGDAVGHPLLAFLGHRFDQLSPSDRIQAAAEFREEMDDTTPGQVASFDDLKRFWRSLVPSLRVLCLSESKDVTSMWLHYADNYRGAVLEFEAVEELDSCFLVARPVEYQDDPPAIADPRTWVRCLLREPQDPHPLYDLITEYQYTKTTAWHYEREWRIVTQARPGEAGRFSDYPFHPRELSGVYLGSQCDAHDRAEMLALLRDDLAHVMCQQAVDGQKGRFDFRRCE